MSSIKAPLTVGGQFFFRACQTMPVSSSSPGRLLPGHRDRTMELFTARPGFSTPPGTDRGPRTEIERSRCRLSLLSSTRTVRPFQQRRSQIAAVDVAGSFSPATGRHSLGSPAKSDLYTYIESLEPVRCQRAAFLRWVFARPPARESFLGNNCVRDWREIVRLARVGCTPAVRAGRWWMRAGLG